MKKIFSLMLALMLMVIPFGASAATGGVTIGDNGNITCDAAASDGSKVCHVKASFTGTGISEVKLKITTNGGATIKDNELTTPDNVDWSIDNAENIDLSNITVSNMAGSFSGTVELFKFTLVPGDDVENCSAQVSLLNEDTTKDVTTDTTTENKKTGATLPYVFLGGALLVAGYLLVSTKNKSKMYKL